MRGDDAWSGSLFSYVDLEARVPGDYSLRLTRVLVNDVLAAFLGALDDAALGEHPDQVEVVVRVR